MAKQFYGLLQVDFETDKDVSTEQFKKFKHEYDKLVEDTFEMMLYDLASKPGFEIESLHPIMEDSSYELSAQDED